MISLPELLGQHWEPGPASWSWLTAKGENATFHVLVLETPTGRSAIGFPPEDMEKFIRSAQEQLTGLKLPVVDRLITP